MNEGSMIKSKDERVHTYTRKGYLDYYSNLIRGTDQIVKKVFRIVKYNRKQI